MKRNKVVKEVLGFVAVAAITTWLIVTAIDNMPPSADELSGKIPMGPVNPAYVGGVK
jgi:hypothetical protein